MSDRYKIVYLPVAERDLSEIFKYINRDSPSAALSLLDKIDEHISRLADFPQLGKTPQDNRLQKLGYKMLIINNYLVFYVVKQKTVEIRRILHGKRKYEFLL